MRLTVLLFVLWLAHVQFVSSASTTSTVSTVSTTTGSTASTTTGITSTESTATTSTVSIGSTTTGSTVSTTPGSTSTGSTGSISTVSTGSTTTGSTESTTPGSTFTGSTGSTSTVSTGSTTTGSTESTTPGSTSTGSTGSTSTVSTGSTTTGSTKSTTAGSTSTGSTGSTSTVLTGSTTTGSTVSTTPGSTSTESTGSTITVSTRSTTTGSTVSTTAGSTSTGITESTGTSAPTTTTLPPRVHCVLEDGPVRFSSNDASPCIVNRLQKHSIQYQSPEFPEKYPNGVECNAKTSSAGPRVLEVTLTLFEVHELDRLGIEGPFRYKKRLGKTDVNATILLPNAYSKIYFKSNDKKRRQGFKLNVISRTNKCQRICELKKGDKGVIKNGPYGSDTFCEWWMEAPAGCFIKILFVKFNVGAAGSGEAWGCDGDYVGVDRDGDPTYAHPNSRTFCGPTPPEGIRSVANKMNILFNGRQGGFNGFKAKYEVVCR